MIGWTAVGIEYRHKRRPKPQVSGRNRVSDVTVTRADGTRDTKPAYSKKEATAIVNKGERAKRQRGNKAVS
jgi:hypothetical protein